MNIPVATRNLAVGLEGDADALVWPVGGVADDRRQQQMADGSKLQESLVSLTTVRWQQKM